MERRIDLEGDEPPGPCREGAGQRAVTGADLAYDVARGGADRLHDPGRHPGVGQEVLAERATVAAGGAGHGPAARTRAGRHEVGPAVARRARCSARSAAWTARTWPAVSSAVPELSTT